jgi:hypothetical protein
VAARHSHATGRTARSADFEGGYAEWARRFAEHLTRLLHDEQHVLIDEALDRWCSYYGKLDPEEAAELAAGIWPNRNRGQPGT